VLWLPQAENVLALVNARTAAAADSALAGLQGGLGQLVSELRSDVLSIITELEARLDFDEDLPPLNIEELKQDIAGGTQRLPLLLALWYRA
jgi:tRNA modification GTPase